MEEESDAEARERILRRQREDLARAADVLRRLRNERRRELYHDKVNKAKQALNAGTLARQASTLGDTDIGHEEGS